MKIFIIGSSNTGKTTLANNLSIKYCLLHLKASKVIRDSFYYKEKDFESSDAFIKAITIYSLDELQKSPDLIIDNIKEVLAQNKKRNCIIEGIRNPRDFFSLFDINEDKIILLKNKKSLKKTTFEKGIDIIENYLLWLEETSLRQNCLQVIKFNTYNEIERILNEKSLFN